MKLKEAQERYEKFENGYSFNILLPLKVNVETTFHYAEQRLPERYNTQDNMLQFMQLISSDLMSYCLAGAIRPGCSFLVGGYVPDSDIWPVFACYLESISTDEISIKIKTFFTMSKEKILSRRRMSDIYFKNMNGAGYENREHVIIGNPYATSDASAVNNKNGASLTSCAKIKVRCTLGKIYADGENYVYRMPQQGKSAIGFARKGAKYIVNAILNGTVKPYSYFYIESANPIVSNRNRHSYCEFLYYGTKINPNTSEKILDIKANRLTTSPEMFTNGPCIGVIDTEKNFVSSANQIKGIENFANKNIGQGSLDNNAMNFEKGADFKLDPNYHDIKKHSNIMEKITISEKQLRKIIKEAFEESRNISEVPYPVASSVSNPDPNTPFVNGPGYKRKVGGEQITKKDQLRRTIFNIIENLEGMCQSYTLEDLVNDVAPRYKVDPNVVREIAKKCISTKDKAGEIYYYEGEGEAGDREYKKVMESVRLNENQLRKVVREAIEQILSESVTK